jgi:hypothetical protein
MNTPLDKIPAEDFDPLVATTLHLASAHATVPAVLEEVCRSPHPTGRDLPGFSLLLRGPAELPLAQGLVTLPHPTHGELQLFMTPIGRDERGFRYEIVFN